jgi:hypothetical protein
LLRQLLLCPFSLLALLKEARAALDDVLPRSPLSPVTASKTLKYVISHAVLAKPVMRIALCHCRSSIFFSFRLAVFQVQIDENVEETR